MNPEDTARLQRIRSDWSVTGITESHSDARFLLRLLDVTITERNTVAARLTAATTEFDQQRVILSDLIQDRDGFAPGRMDALRQVISFIDDYTEHTFPPARCCRNALSHVSLAIKDLFRTESPPPPQKPQSPDLPL